MGPELTEEVCAADMVLGVTDLLKIQLGNNAPP